MLCLDREQRLIYILGGIFGVTDTVAAELLEISSDNFRQRLAGARRDLHNFMNDKCGLVTNRLTGNFPGRPIDLQFIFGLDGTKIAPREIRS